jgi:hypothetical protein
VIKLVEVRILKGELVLGPAEAASDIDVLRDLHEKRDTFHLRELGPKPVDDLTSACIALILRLEVDEDTSVIDRLIHPTGANRRDKAFDARVLKQDLD